MTKQQLIKLLSDAVLQDLEPSEDIQQAEEALRKFCESNGIDYLKLEELVNDIAMLNFEEGFRKGIETVGELYK